MDYKIILKTLLFIAEAFALIVAIWRFPYNKDGKQKHFLHFLIFVMGVEITANLFRVWGQVSNIPVYNVYIIISFLFYFYWFYTHLGQKLIFTVLSLGFLGITATGIIQEGFLSSIINNAVFYGGASLLLLSVWYFIHLLRKEEAIHFLKMQPFWITTGLLIFHLAFLPLNFMLDVQGFNKTYFQHIMTVINIFLYGSIAKGLLCPLKN